MLYSSFNDVTVQLPLDGAKYEAMLMDLIKNSKSTKDINQAAKVVAMSGSYQGK
jgi:hypothetical protein